MCTLEYTIIGAEVNLATRLQSIAEPSGIVPSYETYSLVRKHVKARDYGGITVTLASFGITVTLASFSIIRDLTW